MPFTFAHPAIIIPLLGTRKRLFSATGLVIGSLAPDFESFIRLDIHKVYSHSWLGIFWFNLPLAIVLSFVFHGIVRNALILHLPYALTARFQRYLSFQWVAYFRAHYFVVLVSLLVGITSHLLWDAFTHLNLQYPNAIDSQIYVGPFRLFKILQYSNSLLGLAAIVWYIWSMPQSVAEKGNHKKMQFAISYGEPQYPTSHLKYWVVVAAFSIGSGYCMWHAVQQEMNSVLAIVIGISSIFTGIIMAPILLRINQKD